MMPSEHAADLAEASASKWSYPIDASMPAKGAVAVILETLLDAMVACERGVIERRNEEFLHDYRVAVRRTRSALALFKAALPEPMRREGKELFADLGKRTGAARDLDVLALALPAYLEGVAGADREASTRLVKRVEGEIEGHYAAIRVHLGRASYRRAVDGWRSEIERLSAGREGAPFVELAAAAIRKAAERADRQIEEARGGHAAANAALHRLRIRFKKLRYALEFSTALAPGGEVREAIPTLKTLQDRLGEHQDLVVHQGWIRALCAPEVSDPALADLGRRLGEVLDRRRAGLGDDVRRELTRFRAGWSADLGRAVAALA